MTKRERRDKRAKKRKAENRRKGGYKPPKPPKKSKEFEDPCADPLAGKLTRGVTTQHPYGSRQYVYYKPSFIHTHVRGGTK